MVKIFLGSIMILGLLLSCNPNVDFKTVNNSLTTSILYVKRATDSVYTIVNSNRQLDSMRAAKADSIYRSMYTVSRFLNDLKRRLDEADPTGVNMQNGKEFFLKPQVSDSLELMLFGYCDQSTTFSSSSLLDVKIDSVLNSFCRFKGEYKWASIFFKNSSTNECKMLLSRFQFDYIVACFMSLEGINQEINEEHGS